MRTATITAALLVGIMFSTASYAASPEVADAAMKADVAAVRALLAKKVDVNAPQGDLVRQVEALNPPRSSTSAQPTR